MSCIFFATSSVIFALLSFISPCNCATTSSFNNLSSAVSATTDVLGIGLFTVSALPEA
uniref:Uncharacterized protein n=1 Tax=Yersinia enterocolitica TaxID=630 RepID=B0RL11_YEREN|nr:hypothetical protein [Yersinia enterocolitica]